MSKFTPGPWAIDWYICTEAGKELWRTPRAIGPIAPDHNHWAGWNLGVEEADARLIAAAPEMYESIVELCIALADGLEDGEMEAEWSKSDRVVIAKARAILNRINGDK